MPRGSFASGTFCHPMQHWGDEGKIWPTVTYRVQVFPSSPEITGRAGEKLRWILSLAMAIFSFSSR